MIIFGTRAKVHAVAALFLTCGTCHAEAAQRLFRCQTWFTLFFIPIFPFGHGKYIMQCAYCGVERRLPREAAERFQADAAQFTADRIEAETVDAPHDVR